jgi:hypothetical protein
MTDLEATYASMLYNEDAYNNARREFVATGRMPEPLLHAMFFPLTGNPFKDSKGQVTDFERRWMLTHQYDTREGIAARLVLFRDITGPAMCEWYDCDIDLPLSVELLRPFETQYMNAAAAVAEGELGTIYMSPTDKIMSFQADTKQFMLDASMRHATAITIPENFHMVENMKGGPRLGGKGHRFIRELYPQPAILSGADGDASLDSVRDILGQGHKLGAYSWIGVLQGMSSTIGTAGGNWDIDIGGFFDKKEFPSRLHECREFIEHRTEPMYDGVFFTNYIYRFAHMHRLREHIPLDRYSHDNIMMQQLTNFICNMTSQRMTDRNGNTVTANSHHRWGYQGEDMTTIETSQGRIGYSSMAVN